MPSCTLRASATAAIFLFTTLIAFAQTTEKVKVKVRQSADKSAAESLPAEDVVASGPNTVIVYRAFSGGTMQKVTSRFDAYDMNKLTYLASQDPTDKFGGESMYMERLVHFAGKPRMIGTVRNPKEGTVSVYTCVLDPTLSKPPGAPEPLCRLSGLKVKGGGSLMFQGTTSYDRFTVRVSGDSSHMAVISPELRDKETGLAHYNVAVVDRALKTVWQRDIEVSTEASSSWLRDVLVDNGGVLYLVLGTIKPFPDTKKEGKDISLIIADASGNSEAKVALDRGNKMWTAELTQMNDGAVLCTGTYGAAANEMEGLFCGTVSRSGSGVQGLKYHPLEGTAGMRSFGIMDVVPRSDGGYYLISEAFRAIQYDGYTRNIFGDIQVMSIGANGEKLWSSVFRNLSAYDNAGISARDAVLYKDQLFIFMVESEKMAAKRKNGKEIDRGDASDPYNVHVAFDPKDGSQKVKSILKSEKDTDFISSDIVSLGNDRYFTLTLNGRASGKYSPALIEFSTEVK